MERQETSLTRGRESFESKLVFIMEEFFLYRIYIKKVTTLNERVHVCTLRF
jgi:cytochrome c